MNIRYYIQKFLSLFFKHPIIPDNKTIGYSLVCSEKHNVSLGKYNNIVAPYYLNSVEIGDYSYIAKNCNISNCVIGKFCSIGPNFCCGLGIHPTNGISTSPMFYSTAKQNGTTLVEEDSYIEHKKSFVGNDVFIGANVTVIDGVSIGDGAVIGAGAVVVNDIPPYAIAVGVPARVIKYRFDSGTQQKLNNSKWWNYDEEQLKKVAEFEFDINNFLQ